MDSQPLRVTIYADGGSRGNPGPAAAGVLITADDDGTVLYEGGIFLGKTTNNVAEYQAVVAGLSSATALGAAEVRVISDSELLVKQMNGQYRVRNATLKPLHARARELADRFARCTVQHVRREENTHADKLVNQAINAKRNVEDASNS